MEMDKFSLGVYGVKKTVNYCKEPAVFIKNKGYYPSITKENIEGGYIPLKLIGVRLLLKGLT